MPQGVFTEGRLLELATRGVRLPFKALSCYDPRRESNWLHHADDQPCAFNSRSHFRPVRHVTRDDGGLRSGAG